MKGIMFRSLPLMTGAILALAAFIAISYTAPLIYKYTPVGTVAAAQTSIPPIVIEGNSGFSAHPRVVGGGTPTNPYLISDYIIDCRSSGRSAIAIRNSTAHFVVRNVTIYAASASPGILLRSQYSGGAWQNMNGKFTNVTIIGGEIQVKFDIALQLTFSQCTFQNPSGAGKNIYAYYGYYLHFDRNVFNAPYQSLHFELGTYLFFTRNTGSITEFRHDQFRYSDIANNTMTSARWLLYGGYFSDFQGNVLTSSSAADDLVSFIDCNRIKIANNTLQGGKDGIYISHPNTYSPIYTYYWQGGSLNIEFNRINSSIVGIEFFWTTNHAAINYMSVHHNRITNCSSFGLSHWYGAGGTSRIWHNLFEYNRGSGDTYSTGTSQAKDTYSGFRWTDGKIGHYWRDKTGPDVDSDGIVDDKSYPLDSLTGAKDGLPVTNPYFDFERPTLELVSPKTRFLSNSYLNITWRSTDNLSGIKVVQVKLGLGDWIDRSANDHFGFVLQKGQYHIKLMAIDRANLFQDLEFEITVEKADKPYVVSSPLQGKYYNVPSKTVDYSYNAGFVPRTVSSVLDGGAPIQRPVTGPFSLDFSEGQHSLELSFTDFYGNSLKETIFFTCDLTAPGLEMLYPAHGCVISNELVSFKWSASDLYGMDKTMVRVDSGPFELMAAESFSRLLDEGPHSIWVQLVDRAGNTKEGSTTFKISDNTSLHITAPRFEAPTREGRHMITWEYLSDFQIAALTMAIDNQDPLTLPNDKVSHEVLLTSEGSHRVMVRAEDPVGNTISDSTLIILDKTAPLLEFKFPEDGAFVNETKIIAEWNANERWGIDHYELLLDGILVANDLSQGFKDITVAPGRHYILVKAFDRAGNLGTKNISFTVDVKAPELEIIYPSSSMVTEPYITLSWRGTDEEGILNYNYSIDGKAPVEMGLSTSKQVPVTEGAHTLEVRCMDLARNVKVAVRKFVVDLNPPTIRLIDIPSGYVNKWAGFISWNASDNVGLSKLTLTIDGVDFNLALGTVFYPREFGEGAHTISITVEDNAGRKSVDSVDFFLDVTPPQVSKVDDGVFMDGTTVTVTWSLLETGSDLSGTIYLDDVALPISLDLSSGRATLTEVAPGNHSIKLIVRDPSDNIKELTWTVSVEEAGGGGKDEEASGMIILIAIIVILAIVVTSGSAVYYLRRKGKEPAESRIQSPRRPDSIKIGPMARTAPRTVSAPLIQRPSADTGPSYIRPVHHHGSVIKAPPAPASPPPSVQGHYARPQTSSPGHRPAEPHRPPPQKTEQRPSKPHTHHEKAHPRTMKDEEQVEDWKEETVEEWGEVSDFEDVEELEEV